MRRFAAGTLLGAGVILGTQWGVYLYLLRTSRRGWTREQP